MSDLQATATGSYKQTQTEWSSTTTKVLVDATPRFVVV
jgi:hypothetical protein